MHYFLPKNFPVILMMFLSALSFMLAELPPAFAAPPALSADASLQSAQSAFNKKQYDEAMLSLARVLLVRPSDPEALNLQGAILTKQGKFDAALVCYTMALKESPDFFPARYNVGSLLALRHQWDAAIDYHRNLLIELPDNELVEFKLLLLLLQQNKDFEMQAKLFATDVPTNTPAWYFATAARAYTKGDAAKAAKYLEVAKNIYGDQTAIFLEELDESRLNERK